MRRIDIKIYIHAQTVFIYRILKQTYMLMCNHKIRINIMLCLRNSTIVDPRFQIPRREIGDLFITNMYISHHKIVYNHVSNVDIVSDLQNTQLYTRQK